MEAEAEHRRIAKGHKKNGKSPNPPDEEPDGKSQQTYTASDNPTLKTQDGFID